MKSKKVSDSYTGQVYMVRPPHVNGYGRLFGGTLMQWIDETAGIVSRRHAENTVTTAAIDNLSFKSPAYQNNTIVIRAQMTYVGKTSMEVRVDTYVEELNGDRSLINRAYVVMVSIDKDGMPLQVPGLILETEEEKEEWSRAVRRNDLRKQRRVEGF